MDFPESRPADFDPAAEVKWAEEIRRRVRAYRAGEVRTRPIDQVLDDIERLLGGDAVARELE